MNASLFCTALVLLAVSCSAAPAALISRDWKTPGDGLLTFDDVNQTEWLDLSQTILSQFPGANLEEQYQAVVLATQAGQPFDGFRIATRQDVVDFAASAGLVDQMTAGARIEYAPSVFVIQQLWGNTSANDKGIFTRAAIDQVRVVNGLQRYNVDLSQLYHTPPWATFGFYPGVSFDAGVSLFRTVPEPPAWFLLATACYWCVTVYFNSTRQKGSRNDSQKISSTQL